MFPILSVNQSPYNNNIILIQMLLVALFVAVAAAENTYEYKEPIAITKYGSVSDETGKYSYK